MRVEMQLTGLDGVLELLQRLPANVVSKKGGPVKAALRTGARMLLKEVRKNLRAVTVAATPEQQYSTGLLLKNVIASRGKKPHGSKGERYLVRVRRKAYVRGGVSVTTRATANLLEYGSATQPPEPWLRPAVQSKGQVVIFAVQADLIQRLNAIVAAGGGPP